MRSIRTLTVAAFIISISGVPLSAAPGHDDHAETRPAKASAPATRPAKKTASKPATAAKAADSVIDMGAAGTGKKSAPDAIDHEDPHDDDGGREQESSNEADQDARPAAPASRRAPALSVAPTADEALALLKEGNVRWVSGACEHPNADASRRQETTDDGQHPFATVIACADSRCAVERIFDRGVGDVFVTRVAGNVIEPTVAGTVEYGVEHLHTPLVVVMGHTSCGAVKAAVDGARPGHNIDVVLSEIAPAVSRARALAPDAEGDEVVNLCIRENVYQSMFDLLKTSPMTAKLVSEKKVTLVGAVYDTASGKVQFLGAHPWQEQLVEAIVGRPAASAQQATVPEPDGH